jgi:hypothetical protein
MGNVIQNVFRVYHAAAGKELFPLILETGLGIHGRIEVIFFQSTQGIFQAGVIPQKVVIYQSRGNNGCNIAIK